MLFHRQTLIAFRLCVALVACGDDQGTKNGIDGDAGFQGSPADGGTVADGSAGTADTGPSGEAAGMAPADCAHIDFASYTGGDPVSFRDDILPIVGFGCTASSCHNPDANKAGLNLGWHCNHDTTAKWSCAFPAAPDPGSSSTRPNDEATIAAVYASLMEPATTVNGGTTRRVVPGDPANSFLIVKMADLQGMKGYECTNQSPTSSTRPCGDSMPLNAEPYCQGAERKRFDATARWIAQGAPNN